MASKAYRLPIRVDSHYARSEFRKSSLYPYDVSDTGMGFGGYSVSLVSVRTAIYRRSVGIGFNDP
jgi:hypothetical protein